MTTRPRSHTHRTTTARRALAFVAAGLTAISLIAVPAAPAFAAGPGVLNVQITPVDYATGNPQTTAAAGQHGNRVAYRVDYSCAVAECTDTTVRLSAPQPNPYGIPVASSYLGAWGPNLLSYSTWTAPTAGGTISGDDTTGKLVSLGNVPAGVSGSFLMVYAFPASINRTIVPAQLYPNGFQIVHSATIESPNATAPVAATASPVTWNINVPATPGIVITSPGTVKPGVNVGYQVRMNSGAMGLTGGNIYGAANLQAAGNHTVRMELPAQAVFVSADGGGTYDSATHTVNWAQGTEASPTYCAGGGWGSTAASSGTWNVTGPCYAPRNVVVNYPAANFPDATDGCNFDTNVQPRVSVDVTYLDTVRTKKSASASATHSVSCYDPFGRLNVVKDSTNDDGGSAIRQVYVPPVVTGLVCDTSGFDDWGRACTPGQALAPFGNNTKQWQVSAYNAGNVPGVATITDSQLDQPGMPVTTIQVTATAPLPTIDYTYQCGTSTPVSGTVQQANLSLSTLVGATPDCRFTAATLTSGVLAAGNIRPADTGVGTLFRANFIYTVAPGTATGVRTDTMSATMTYPDYPEITGTFTGTATRQVNLRGWPTANIFPAIAAAFPATPVVAGGGQAVPGREVTFSVNGTTARFGGTSDFAPQYVFVAPTGWTVKNGSAAFAAAVPAGVTFTYRTATFSGVERQLVVASWPAGTLFGRNATLPTMTVVATPTYSVAAGTTSTANVWIGDSRNVWNNTNATFTGGVADAPDADGDGLTTEWFANAAQSILVSSAAGASVLKEICRPDATATDGCEWLGDPTRPVPVSTSESSIKYRVTIQNTGNANLTGVVGYDVLPYVGDTGTSDGTAATPRGSTFDETLVSTSNVSAGLTLSYSSSTNPPRAEVFSGATSGTWGATAAGAKAIRATYGGTLAPGQSVSFTYTAGVGTGATADSIACNSIAIDTAQTVPSEPPAVCAVTAEADLAVTVPERLPLQVGRPGVVPFVVTNHGGSVDAPATVTVDIPAGLTVSSLTPAGWTCTAEGETAPVAGPVELSCQPVDGSGAITTIALGTPRPLEVSVVPSAAAASLCVTAEVAGRMVDPVAANNDTEGCMRVVALSPALDVDKDDSRTVVAIGDQYTYQIVVRSQLVGESLTGVALTDALPAGVRFVSASDGGTLSGAAADGSGGTVTWAAVDLDETGAPSAGGDDVAGAGVTEFTRSVTVRVVAAASGVVSNTARAVAVDPADPTENLEATDSDVDDLRRLTVTKASDAPAAGVRAGDTVEYTVTITNSGTADYDAATPVVVVDDLSLLLDDATFVAGSAGIVIGSGSPSAVADPTGGLLTWSGELAAGGVAQLTYRVQVGDGSAGDRRLVNTVYASGDVSSCAAGVDPEGVSCATTSTPFAPLIDKRISSFTQGDDGRWTIVYDIDVTNLNQTAPVGYRLEDSPKFGPGITIVSATLTSAPAGVTPAPWTGTGLLATAQVPADGVHSYRVTVVADAAGVAGTAAAVCTAGVPGGFANVATLTADGDDPVAAEVCASPVAPTVDKTVATPVQQPDGTWIVTYTITVTNPNAAPAAGLPFTLDDTLALPAGVQVLGVTASGPAGAPLDPAFDGDASTALLTGADRVAAAPSASVPATRVYTVTLHAAVPAGAGTASSFACAPAGTGGYANAVTLFAGTSATEVDSASACAAVTPLPTPQIQKRVVSTSVDATSGEWTIGYEIVVTNPSSQFATSYDLDDDLQFAAGASIVDATISSTDASLESGWNGESAVAAVRGQLLPAGASDVFQVQVVVDPSAVDSESAAADCRLDAGESGTGFRNLATVRSGTASAFAAACEPATDPSVVKTVASAPVQDPATGIWTVVYEVLVTNRSTTTVAGGIPYTVDDTLELPTGVTVAAVTATTTGGTVNPDFDGAGETRLGSGSIMAAANDSTPAQHAYTVTVQFRVPGGLTADVQCSPSDATGGLLNVAEITVGSRVSGATACAGVPDVPLPGVTKSVLSQVQQPDGSWQLVYGIEVGNPSTTAAVRYTVRDEFGFGAGISVVGSPVVVSAPSGALPSVNPGWNGAGDALLAEGVLLPAGGSHSYAVRVTVDTGSLTGDDPAADCTLGAGETGTGLLNRATLSSGAATVDAEACATIHDPAVTKTVAGVPVQQADGSWLVSYTMSVSNPSAVVLRYGLVDELDFPAGSTVTVQSASARSGGPAVVAGWDGQTQLQLVAGGTAIGANAVHAFDVTLRVVLAAGQGSLPDGFANTATVVSGVGGAVTSDADAAADLLVPEIEVEKTVVADAVPRIGSTASYEIVIRNVGDGAFTTQFPAVVWDDLTGVLDDAALSGAVTATPAAGTITTVGERISWRGALASGGTVTLSYDVTIGEGGDGELDNVAFAALPLETDPSTPSGADCDASTACSATATGLPAVQVLKSASATRVAPGDTVTYTVRVVNTGTVDIPDADPVAIDDDLTNVLAGADYRADARADRGTVDVAGGHLTWTGGLAVGETATITYSVGVRSSTASGTELTNVVVSDPTLLSLTAEGTPAPRTATTVSVIDALASTGATPMVLIAALSALLAAVLGGAMVLVRRRQRRA